MEQIYWITEYGKLFLAYAFVMFLWPSVVFRGFLAGKGRTFRFAFCTTVMVMLINTVVLLLGLVKLLYVPVVAVLFFGTFLVRLLQGTRPGTGWVRDLRSLTGGTISRQRLLLRWWSAVWGRIRERIKAWWQSTRGKRLEYGVLLVLLVFGTLYFVWPAFDEHVYGCGDQYVHHRWIYGLVQNSVFQDGVYPEGMHCVIYLVCECFGISLYSGMLFFPGVQISLTLVAAYLMMREMFRWHGSALIGLTLFLTLDQNCVNMIVGMCRLGWTLPLEYGLYAMFLCPALLIRFYKRVARGERLRIRWRSPREWGKLVQDPDLFPFGMAVGVTLAVHFYVTIIAFFLCLVVALVYLRQVFKPGSFAPMVVSVFLAVIIAAAPMGAAFAAGYPPQGSLGWALEVMNGGREPSSPVQNETPLITPSDASGASEADAARSEPTPSREETSADPEGSSAPTKPSLVQRVGNLLRRVPRILYQSGYVELLGEHRANLTLVLTAVVFVLAFSMHLALLVRQGVQWFRARKGRPLRKQKLPSDAFAGYLIIVLTSVVLIVLLRAGALGLPQLVDGTRVCSSLQLYTCMLYVVGADWVLSLATGMLSEGRVRAFSAAACVGVYFFTQIAGVFHGFLYFQLTRYRAAVETTNQIIQNYPAQMYTIISTTDEYYQVVETGYHEELLTLIQHQTDAGYMLPTPYVFLFLEKHPLRYAQYHFPQGPAWLAAEKYQEYFAVYSDLSSQCPEVVHGEVSEAHADENIAYTNKLSETATLLPNREILESKGFRWMERFRQLYPEVSRVIYEDDDFICYAFSQNPYRLFTLGIFVRY